MKQSELIEQLNQTSKRLIEEAKHLETLPADQLSKRPKEGAWNALECFEHMNLYMDIYNNFFDEALTKAKPIMADRDIVRGYFGNRFINWMEPKESGMTTMKTFKSKDPIGKPLSKSVIQHFIRSNARIVDYLEEAKSKDIQKVKCRLAVPLLKIKLSDAMHFLISHNERHMLQVQRAIT